MFKPRLFTPGPTPIPEPTLGVMARQPLYHRSREFKAVLGSVNAKLQSVFGTTQPVLTLAGSGTGGVEASMHTIHSAGDKAIYIESGKFSTRWGTMLRTLGCNPVAVSVPWGEAVTTEQLQKTLHNHPDARAVWLTHSETSTGVATDIRSLARLIRNESDALVCVDGISSVGAMECPMDSWGLDVLVTGSQKGLMLPPGLALVALSERAWDLADRSPATSMYLDLNLARNRWEEDSTPWTPASSLIVGLESALTLLLEEGLNAVYRRHAVLSQALRSGLEALRLRLFGVPPSHAVTAVWLPDRGEEFMHLLKHSYNVTVSPGQERLKGKIFRVAHLGYVDSGDIIAVISAIELALKAVGHTFDIGAGLAGAQRIIADHDQTGP